MKMKNKLQTLFSLLRLISVMSVSLLLLGACSKKPERMEYVSGIVKSVEGDPLADVEVKSNGYIVKTDALGSFTIEHVENVDGRYILKFSKKGYFPVTRSGESGSVGLMEVVLVKENQKEVSTTTKFTSTKGATVRVGGMAVEFPKDGIIYEDGTSYKGTVDVKVLYLDPKKPIFPAAMPGGDLVARDSSLTDVPLVSYGMVNVELRDAKGAKLQVNDEVKSKVTFPIPEGMLAKAPEKMPLWHFNESTGKWEESGLAVKNGDVYEGEVEHFSWVNLDDPKQFVVLKGKVKDADGRPLSGVRIVVEQVSVYSDEEGEYSVRIPSETDVTVTVRKEDYLNYDNEFSVTISGQPGNSTYKQDIVLPVMPSVTGKLENMCDDNVIFPVYCCYEVDGRKNATPFSLPKKDGTFSVRVPSNATKVSLCVKVPGMDDLVREIEFEGSDYQIVGSLSLCRKNLVDRETPHLTVDGKETVIEVDELDYIDFTKTGVTVGGSGITVTIDKYTEGAAMMDGKVTIEKYGFESSSARIEKRTVDNHVNLVVVATGKALGEDGSTMKDATFEGVLTASYMYHGKCSDFSELCWDKSFPEMRCPISYASQESFLGMPLSAFIYDKATDVDFKRLMKMSKNVVPFMLYIGYNKANKATFEKISSVLKSAGYEEVESKRQGKHSYSNGEVNFDIYFEEGMVWEFRDGGSKMQMTVSVSTGWDKWIKALAKKYLFDWLS